MRRVGLHAHLLKDPTCVACLQADHAGKAAPGSQQLLGAPLLDHMLVDLKHVDPNKLRDQAHAQADLMLENLRWALAHHAEVLPRTPVVPGFNNSLDDARAMARWLRSAGGTRVQLLPFHNFGEGKYALQGVRNLREDDLEDYRQAYLEEGVEAFF